MNEDKQINEVYGDINEDPEFQQVTQNPYYANDVELDSAGAENSTKHNNANESKIITCTKNVYYEMWWKNH